MASQQSGINSWLEDELLQEFRHDRASVDPSWKSVFEHNGTSGATALNGAAPVNGASHGTFFPPAVPPPPPSATDELIPLRGAAAKIAENMAASVSIPLATSQRIIAVKVIDENRRLINHHRGLVGR